MTKESIYRQKLDPYFPGEEQQVLDQLLEHSDYLYKSLFRYSGEPYLHRALRLTVDKILKLNPDRDTIIASVLINACYSPRCDLDKIEKLFGSGVRKMVASLGRINAIKSRYSSSDTKVIAKMFLSLADDIRVVLIRLAERIENMETLQFKGLEKQKANAREILEVYVPMASRLGLYEFKLTLEDLAFKYVFPQEYKDLKKEMDDYISESTKNIEDIKHELESLMFRNGFEVTVSGRVKNLFSIYKKLKKKTATLKEIYDVYALRIIAKTDANKEEHTQEDYEKLYKILSCLHSKYDKLSDRFKDYVANPKSNGYQSLHTALVGLNAKEAKTPTEVQIRTDKMHKFAENGHAAHWIYKESLHLPPDEDLLSALDDIKKRVETVEDPGMTLLKMNLYKDRIFVLTPENLVKELPIGGTPVDFAYAIHSEIGHTCYLAKVNGQVVPLDYALKNGDIVEIIRSHKNNTKLSWLGFVKSKQARNRIKNYFRSLDKDSLLDQGKEELNSLFERLKMPALDEGLNFLKIYKGKNITLKEREEILEELGSGVLTLNVVFKNAYGKSPEAVLAATLDRQRPSAKKDQVLSKDSGSKLLLIGGAKNMPYRVASCCKPKLTDSVVAYVTKTKGVSLHKVNCGFVKAADQSRLLEAKLQAENDH